MFVWFGLFDLLFWIVDWLILVVCCLFEVCWLCLCCGVCYFGGFLVWVFYWVLSLVIWLHFYLLFWGLSKLVFVLFRFVVLWLLVFWYCATGFVALSFWVCVPVCLLFVFVLCCCVFIYVWVVLLFVYLDCCFVYRLLGECSVEVLFSVVIVLWLFWPFYFEL